MHVAALSLCKLHRGGGMGDAKRIVVAYEYLLCLQVNARICKQHQHQKRPNGSTPAPKPPKSARPLLGEPLGARREDLRARDSHANRICTKTQRRFFASPRTSPAPCSFPAHEFRDKVENGKGAKAGVGPWRG